MLKVKQLAIWHIRISYPLKECFKLYDNSTKRESSLDRVCYILIHSQQPEPEKFTALGMF